VQGLCDAVELRIGGSLFYEMRGKDYISLTAMIAGFTQNGFDIKAIDLFKDEITKF